MVLSDASLEPIPGRATDPVFGLPEVWVPTDTANTYRAAGATVINRATVLVTHLSKVIETHAAELLTRQDVRTLLDELGKSAPEVAGEFGDSGVLSLAEPHEVLRELLREGVSAAARAVEHLVEAARVGLGATICDRVAAGGQLRVLTFDPSLEATLVESVRDGAAGSWLALDGAPSGSRSRARPGCGRRAGAWSRRSTRPAGPPLRRAHAGAGRRHRRRRRPGVPLRGGGVSFPGPPCPARPYATAGEEEAPAPGFRSALTAALAATKSVEDVVVDPAPGRAAPVQGPVLPHALGGPAAAGEPAAAGVTVVAHGDGWRVSARTLPEAVAATAALGEVTLHDARQVARGIGPWRRAHVELTARPATTGPAVNAGTTPGPGAVRDEPPTPPRRRAAAPTPTRERCSRSCSAASPPRPGRAPRPRTNSRSTTGPGRDPARRPGGPVGFRPWSPGRPGTTRLELAWPTHTTTTPARCAGAPSTRRWSWWGSPVACPRSTRSASARSPLAWSRCGPSTPCSTWTRRRSARSSAADRGTIADWALRGGGEPRSERAGSDPHGAGGTVLGLGAAERDAGLPMLSRE